LNDGGPVLFKHIGTSSGAATRPATKAGGFRIFRGIDEIHEVENTSELPSHFLRVEFKTDPTDPSTLRGRFYREVVPPGENLEKVQFENAQVRLTRILVAPGRSARVETAPSEPTLLIALREASVRTSDGSTMTLGLGRERWLPAGTAFAFENGGSEPSEFLRFDFKTGPTTSSEQRYLNGRIARQQQLGRAAGPLLVGTVADLSSYAAVIIAFAVVFLSAAAGWQRVRALTVSAAQRAAA
jgi:hypothetical protein